jgi:hypothetical protein
MKTNAAIAACLFPSLIATTLWGCATETTRPVSYPANSTSSAAKPGADKVAQAAVANPATQGGTVAQAPANAQTGGSQTNSASDRAFSSQQTVICTTPNYFAEISWNRGEPNMNVGRRPSQSFLNSPADFSREPNGSLTYTNQRGETDTSVRFESTHQRCTIRVIGADLVNIDEMGQVSTGSTNNNNQANAQDYQEGYRNGFERGFREGSRAKLNNIGYDPDASYQMLTPSGNASYDRGIRDGFFKGFDEGYYSTNTRPPNTGGGRPALW